VTFRDAPTHSGPAVVDSDAGAELPSTWTTTDTWSNAPLSAFGTT